MKLLQTLFIVILITSLTSCASGYKPITPETLDYSSTEMKDGVTLKYRYNLLDKKYGKKEVKKGIRVAALRIENNSGRDLQFGKDLRIVDSDGSDLYLLSEEQIFRNVKQSTASYLWYLLLTPLNFTTTETTNGVTEETSSFPLGLIVGPGLAGGNMIAAGNANKKFQSDLQNYNLDNIVIKNGETVHGIIGIQTDSFKALKLSIN